MLLKSVIKSLYMYIFNSVIEYVQKEPETSKHFVPGSFNYKFHHEVYLTLITIKLTDYHNFEHIL